MLRVCGQRTHISCDAAAEEFVTKKPIGHYESTGVSWADCLPSDSNMVAVQLVETGPVTPSSKGPQTSDTVEFVLIDLLATRINCFAYDDEAVNKQLSLRTEGAAILEKNPRGEASDGNVPVMVSAASPAYDKLLGSIRKKPGEKSRTGTAIGRLMMKTGALLVP